MAAVAAQSPSANDVSNSSVQIQVATIATSSTTAKASASTSPAMLPRSQSQGRPGQRSVRERIACTVLVLAPGDGLRNRGGGV